LPGSFQKVEFHLTFFKPIPNEVDIAFTRVSDRLLLQSQAALLNEPETGHRLR
jgi:hypothetical protein